VNKTPVGLSRVIVLAATAAVLAAACDRSDSRSDDPGPAPAPAWDPAARKSAIAEGRAVIEKHECTRCHTIDALRTPGDKYTRRARDCVSCHAFIKGLEPGKPLYERIAKNNGKEVLDRYIAKIQHLLRVPNLTNVARRIRPDWIATYLQEPFDLRPVMSESMYRNALTRDESRKIARYLAAVANVEDPFAADARPVKRRPRPSAKRIAEGKQAFVNRACHVCHTFGNVSFGTATAKLYETRAMTELAPNLRFVRDRMRPEVVVAWIMNPQAVQPSATMPNFAVPKETAELIRDYLFYGDPEIGPAPTARRYADAMKLPPAVERPVDWVEVKEKVLGQVCVHCHMNDYEKDTGPGNTGGMGYAGLGLSFRTYRRIVWGARDKKTGERYSVLVPREGEKLPRLLQVLLIRRVENMRDYHEPFADHALPVYPAKDVLGMPMGFAALSDEQIGIVRAWIEQGCKGRNDVSGKPGFDDGYLVADGPVKKNQGCELRKPGTPPPDWTVEAYRNKHGKHKKGGGTAKKPD
jgi:mono/diheme cytochrome c family protein